jgi:hypothetical protein
MVLDNYATCKTPAIRQWLLKHPRFHLHFSPTSSSWMNLAERWFAELTTVRIQSVSRASDGPRHAGRCAGSGSSPGSFPDRVWAEARGAYGDLLVDCDSTMTHSHPKSLDLLLLSRQEAARIAACAPGAEDRWAEGFPREEDCGPAARLTAASTDPGPFGAYKLVARKHGRIIGTAASSARRTPPER